MYIILWAITVLFGFLGVFSKKNDRILFNVEYVFMFVALILRYGQGTDYFGYSMDYLDIPSKIDIYYLFHNDNHGEAGFLFLCELFKCLHCPFTVFASIVSMITMILIYVGINTISIYRTVSWMLFFPTCYSTFCYSSIRQGLVLAIVISITIPAYHKNNKAKYILSVVLGSLFHSSALILLFVPILLKFVNMKRGRFLNLAVMCGIGIGAVLRLFNIQWGHYIYFSPSYGAIIIRIILLVVVTRLLRVLGEDDKVIKEEYSFYFLGMCFFFALASMGFISNKMTIYFKVMESALIPNLLYKIRTSNAYTRGRMLIRKHVVYFLVILCIVETGKNYESYVKQGQYVQGTHFYNYPYVSLFDKSKIFEYRDNLRSIYNEEVF